MSEFFNGVAAPLISGASTLIGTALQGKYNKQLAEQQNQYNIDMWKMQADYNSPQAQMQRFMDAGLNPNLIYGQGSSGNMSSPPEQVVPQSPDIQKAASDLARIFNIENIRTLRAKRKEAEAVADNARTNATRNERELFAEEKFGQKYMYDYELGQYVPRVSSDDGVDVIHPSAYYLNRLLERNYNAAHLIPFREALLAMQHNYLVPQVVMSNYEAKHYPVSYWVGQGSKALNSLTSIPKAFSPLQWSYKPPTHITKKYY